jgi:hypothetical protein
MDHATHNETVSFYVHQPLRDLAEVVKEIRDLETETEGLLEKILSFSA